MTRKNKNIALTVGFCIALIICYQLAISKTIAQKELYTKFKEQDLLFKNTPKQLALLKQKERHYDSLLLQYKLEESSIQNNLLKTINIFADSTALKVISFLKPHTINKNNVSIKTYEFIVEGEYNNINQLIYQLEQKTKFGEIIHLHFEKKKNFRTGTYYLQAKVLLRSFE